MRTIIISDITETDESIIPYGLNVGKHTQTRVDILHYFDPKLVHGTYSPVSDSQSMTPGEKLSHDEILQREKEIARAKIDKLLSREGSRLNYPLRIKSFIDIADPDSAIIGKINEHNNPLVITGTDPSQSMVNGLKDLLVLLQNSDVRILIVPAGKKFVKPVKCCLVTDLVPEGNQKLEKLFEWIGPLTEKIYTSAVIPTDSNSDQKERLEEWKQALEPYTEKLHSDASEVVRIDESGIAIENICRHKSPDMVVFPKNGKSHFSQYLLANNNLKKFSESFNIPVMLY